MANPLDDQADELEALKSIFDGDENFNVISSTSVQYKCGVDGDQQKSFLLGLEWPPNYPQCVPVINLDLFYNKPLLPKVKSYIHSKLLTEAEANVGMGMTFTLIDFAKENLDDLLKDQTIVAADEAEEGESHSEGEEAEGGRKERKDATGGRSQMTKAQKRKMWDRAEGGTCGERERGYDWVDIVKHLSQAPSSTA
uniref:RWD domain-containing protein n=1 Tax=Plectus sambesii TaxID=2011161 RepID=A0A914XKK8_9BILA